MAAGRGPRRCGRGDRGRASRRARSSGRPTRSPRRSTPASGSSSGVNRFAVDDEEPYEPLRVDPAIEAEQAERLATLRAERDGDAVDAGAGRGCRRPPRGTDNVLLPDEATRCAARATVGEVCDALREVWGTYVPVDAF